MPRKLAGEHFNRGQLESNLIDADFSRACPSAIQERQPELLQAPLHFGCATD